MILIACEESQAVTLAFRRLGYEAYSCDTQPCSGGHPEWHLRQPVEEILDRPWRLIIAFPPCTHLCRSGAAHFKRKADVQPAAIRFFMKFTATPCPTAIENPVGIMSTYYRKPDQIIQPWQFGHGETKATCLWLRGLPPLRPTNIVDGRVPRIHKLGETADRSKIRSKTYPGIAEAMATQWCRYVAPDPNEKHDHRRPTPTKPDEVLKMG